MNFGKNTHAYHHHEIIHEKRDEYRKSHRITIKEIFLSLCVYYDYEILE